MPISSKAHLIDKQIMKKIFFFIFCFSITTKVVSQSFTINGILHNVNSGKVFLVANTFSRNFYGNNSKLDSSEILKGKFKIIKKFVYPFPLAYRFIIQSDNLFGTTDFVFIYPKDQSVIIDSIDQHIAPIIVNSLTQNEIRFIYNPYFKEFIKEVQNNNIYEDSLINKLGNNITNEILLSFNSKRKNTALKSDSLFYEYSKEHRNSYVTLWKLIERVNNNGYRKLYDTIFGKLSNNLRNSFTGSILRQQLKEIKQLSISNKFPTLELTNIYLKKEKLNKEHFGNSYTLIDFWFSSCGPCLKEFPSFKSLYQIYSKKGFKIIGVSVDSKVDQKKWKKSILNNNLKWKQFLDENGKIAKKLTITSFPSNFLLNKEGEIIKKNISTLDLKKFLDENLYLNEYFDKVLNEPN